MGKKKRIILVLDRALWHTSDRVKVPRGIHLFFLPADSPELQPAERLWPLTDEPIANRSFESLDELEAVLFERCRRLLQQQELIRGLTFFHWWPCGAVPSGVRCEQLNSCGSIAITAIAPGNWSSDRTRPAFKENVNSRWY